MSQDESSLSSWICEDEIGTSLNKFKLKSEFRAAVWLLGVKHIRLTTIHLMTVQYATEPELKLSFTEIFICMCIAVIGCL